MTVFRDGARDDRPLLQGFRCTRPPERDQTGKRLAHPRPWEAEVEAYFHDLKPPGRKGNLIRLGFDNDDDLASAVSIEALNPRAKAQTPEFFVAAVAVSLRERGKGGRTADDAFTDALAQLAERVLAAGRSELLISGRIHAHNAASQAMAIRNGLAPGPVRDGDPYVLWRVTIEVD